MFRKIRIWLIRRLGGVDFAKYKQALDTVGALCEKEQYLQEKIKQLEHKCNYAHYILERDDSKY